MDIVLIQQHIKTLEKQYKTLEDDLCVLRLVLQQLSKEEWALANYMDLHRSLLVSSDQRLAFIAPRVPSVSMSPSQVYIKYIAFEFTSENTDLKVGLLLTMLFVVSTEVLNHTSYFPLPSTLFVFPWFNLSAQP